METVITGGANKVGEKGLEYLGIDGVIKESLKHNDIFAIQFETGATSTLYRNPNEYFC
ncbi:hypothetical protein LX64_01844 [Chitinophaga skermanii]|uniref:Uncharacterized protein n=1 Tax=Chitinophaga skermanii TaxID=331697 RepID=A0A327QYH3_9BACT|nr:hypothetical protein [Chitinophaga skermanii]RAJ06717.1 hypothetical protein LX64_01844 [Chitinophaga skermanii]